MANDERKGFGAIIAETAAATAFWLVVGVALLASLFPILFPSQAAEFYFGVGNLPRAYSCAAKAAERSDDFYEKVKAANYALRLYETEGEAYAVLACAPELLAESETAFKSLDEANVAAVDKRYRPSVYSYRDRLAATLASATAENGETKIYIGGEPVNGNEAVNEKSSLVLVQIVEKVRSNKIADQAITTEFGTIDELIAYAKSYAETPRSGLDEVYAALVYARAIDSLEKRFTLTPEQTEYVKIGALAPAARYNELLANYVK